VAVATATADGDEDVVDPDERPGWTFLSNHGHVLVCLAQDPGLRIREIAATVGITERAAQGIVNDLVDGGYLTRERVGRRNRYQVHDHEHLRHPNESEHTIGDLLAGLVGND
jgi:predicted ArsR family transcriptional regulator